MKVILASASPRRQALLQQIGITPLVCPADFAEGSGTASQAQEVALYNAAGKCAAVAAKMGDELVLYTAEEGQRFHVRGEIEGNCCFEASVTLVPGENRP